MILHKTSAFSTCECILNCISSIIIPSLNVNFTQASYNTCAKHAVSDPAREASKLSAGSDPGDWGDRPPKT